VIDGDVAKENATLSSFGVETTTTNRSDVAHKFAVLFPANFTSMNLHLFSPNNSNRGAVLS